MKATHVAVLVLAALCAVAAAGAPQANHSSADWCNDKSRTVSRLEPR